MACFCLHEAPLSSNINGMIGLADLICMIFTGHNYRSMHATAAVRRVDMQRIWKSSRGRKIMPAQATKHQSQVCIHIHMHTLKQRTQVMHKYWFIQHHNTPPSKRMAQNLDLCHLLCIRTHVKTHLRHLPQNYLTTDKGSTAQGEKNLKNLVIQKRIFRWHLRHLLWLAWFPSKKYWIDGASANLWAIPLTCVCCLRQETV